MNTRNFRIIKGGISTTFNAKERIFVSAYATDTRLMGVVALSIHWKLKNDVKSINFHQFFYYDAEDYGIDTYKSIIGSDVESLDNMERTLIGGLGATKIDLTEEEVRFLLCHFSKTNYRLNQPLPEGKSQFMFLLDEASCPELEKEQQRNLLLKLCTPIKSTYQLANYFLMRLFAHDTEGIDLLASSNISVRGFFAIPPSTFFKNNIEEFQDEDGVSFLCESLIEHNGTYQLIVSDLKISKDFKITSAIRMTSFLISDHEASMLLSKPEYITAYDIMELEPIFSNQLEGDFDYYFNKITGSCLVTEHPHGRMYLRFNNHNDHVDNKHYRLNDDVFATYYLSDDAQLIVTAPTESRISFLERELMSTPLGLFLLFLSKYRLKQALGYQFIHSEYCGFEDFMASSGIDFTEDGNEEY